MKRGEDVGGEGRVGLEPRGVLGAEIAGEKRGEAEVIGDEAGRRGVFVGENRHGEAACVQVVQQRKSAGEGEDIVEHRTIPVGAINFHGGGDLVGADEFEQGVFEAAADGVAHLGERGFGLAELRQGVRVAAMDGGEVVDERAVEVEEKGAKLHERKEWRRAWGGGTEIF